jgi:hypothetical protein
MLDREQFVNTMTGLCDLYGKPLSEFILDTYYDIFKDYEFQQFESAVRKCVKEKVYNTLPKPAEILEFLEGTRDDKALIGWLQVKEAITKGGYHASIEFSDPIIANAINELGGWQWICMQDKSEEPFIQKRFMDLYRLFLKRGVNRNIKLIGFIEARNSELGHKIPEPIRIGFAQEPIKELTNKNE